MKEYDQDDENQRKFIKTYASAAIPIPKEEWSKIENTEPKWNKDKTRADPPPLDTLEKKLEFTRTGHAQKTKA